MTELEILAYMDEYYTYNPEDGNFYWKKPVNNRIRVGMVVGTINSTGYRQATIKYHMFSVSRLVWLYFYKRWPANVIDHINGVSDDNRIENLRDVTWPEDARNRKNNVEQQSGESYVIWDKKAGKWYLTMPRQKGRRFIGQFHTVEEAVQAREAYLAGIGEQAV